MRSEVNFWHLPFCSPSLDGDGLSLNLEFAFSAGLAGQRVLASVPPALQHHSDKHAWPGLAFYVDAGDLNSGQVLMLLQQALYPLSHP